MQTEASSSGLFSSLRRLADTGLGAFQNRFELFALEFREERSHLVSLAVHLAIALFFGMMAVIVLTGVIIFAFSPEARLYVAGGFCLLYIVGAAIAFARVKAKLNKDNLPFSETLNEVKKDREWIRQE